MSTDSCVFCKIVALTEPAILVHESETTLAFLDARPVSRGHTLVVPKRHAENLDALESHEGAEMFRVARSSPELYAAATSPLTESTFSSTTAVQRAKPCSTRTCTSSPAIAATKRSSLPDSSPGEPSSWSRWARRSEVSSPCEGIPSPLRDSAAVDRRGPGGLHRQYVRTEFPASRPSLASVPQG